MGEKDELGYDGSYFISCSSWGQQALSQLNVPADQKEWRRLVFEFEKKGGEDAESSL